MQGLANGVKTADDFLRLGLTSKIAAGASPGNAPSIPLICIPISLSGGEYSRYSGVTDTRTHLKTMLTHEKMFPNLVILDAELTVSTPMQIWLSSGVRSIDHCVEGFLSKNPTKESDAAALEGLSFLVNGLLRTKGNPEDLDARLQCQLGSNLSMTLLYLKVWKGASHGIGHQLGPQGVGHGETSCILLPAVCKYNAKVNGEKQAILKKVLCLEEAVRKVLKEAGVDEEKADLGDILRAIFNALGMPKSLREVGVGREKLDELATNSLQDHFVHTNPVPLDDKSQVLELLEMVVE
jgi:alcohol dehydrogenase class IV